jgi:hypothetical protein
MFRIVSIMPGMENFAPDRHETSSGRSASPNFLPVAASMRASAASSCSHMPPGNCSPAARYALHASVVTVKPGGTGTSSRVMSPRFAPLPPSRERTPSQLPTSASASWISSKP